MGSTVNRIILGFVAGALAVLIFHQGMYALMQSAGMPLRGRPLNLSPNPNGVPVLLNSMFWGGLWGSLFALVYAQLGDRPGWLKGIAFGMLGPMLLGSWLFFAYLRGEPLLAGLAPQRMLIGFLLNGVAFGLGVGLIYPWLQRTLGSGSAA